jgi:rod shape-determining protein MreC
LLPVTGGRTTLLRTALVWLLLEILAASQVRTVHGSTVLWGWLHGLAQPFVWSSQQLGQFATDLATGLRDSRLLLIDHRKTRVELEEARARNLLLREDRAALREANHILRSWVGYEESSLVGRCVFRNLASGRMEIRLDSRIDIVRDTPVLSADGLVGRVVRSSGRSHWVELLTHPAAAVAVQTTDGSVRGLVTGTGQSHRVSVQYIPRSAQLLRGDGLVTSGADGIYPAGIPVSRIIGIRESDAPFLEVSAVPTADLGTLRVVLLLPDWVGSPGPEAWP